MVVKTLPLEQIYIMYLLAEYYCSHKYSLQRSSIQGDKFIKLQFIFTISCVIMDLFRKISLNFRKSCISAFEVDFM